MRHLFIQVLLCLLSISVFATNEEEKSFENISVEKFVEMMSEDDVVIIDVRSLQELGSGYVEGAINIDYYSSDFKFKLDALDKDKTYLIYCRSGNRSGKTLKIMKGLNFKKVYNLIGGVGALNRYGYILVEPS